MAVETSADLLTQLRQEVGFDVDGGDVTLLGWLNVAHRLAVARSKCYRDRIPIPGGTVVGQGDYVLPPEVLEVRSVEIGGVIYDRVSRGEVIQVRSAEAVFVGPGGVVAQGANGSSSETLTIYPAPTTVGLEVAVFGPVRAPELTVSGIGTPPAGATNSPVVPVEFFPALVNKAAGVGLRRTESRYSEAISYDQEFDTAVEELRRQVRRRWNTGPTRVRIAWP